MAYEKRQKKKSQFTTDNTIGLTDSWDRIKNGVNVKSDIDTLLDKVADVYGMSARVYDTQSELVADDIRVGEIAIVKGNRYAMYSIGNLTAGNGDVTLTSGYVATQKGKLQPWAIEAYSEFPLIDPSILMDNEEITVVGTASTLGIRGPFTAIYSVSHGITSTTGVQIRISDDWYAQRVYDTLHVKWFEAVGDGATNDTAALLAAFAALPSGQLSNAIAKIIEFEPEKVYLFTPPAFGINLDTIYGFQIKGNFAEIKVPDGTAAAANGVIMWLEDCVDGTIENLIFNGNLPNRTGSEGAGAHNVKLRNQNQNIKFINCKFRNATTDGFYMDASSNTVYSRDVHLIDCEASGCYRGNISIIDSERFRMRGGSAFNASGVNPQHGLDFEDNGIYGNKNFIVEDVDFYSNDGEGIQISGSQGVTNGKFKNIRLWDNGKGDDASNPGNDFGSDLRIGLFNGLVLEDIYVKGNTNDVTRASIDFTASASNGLIMKNINMKGINLTGTGTKYCIYMHSNITGEVDIEGVTIDGTNSPGFYNDVHDITLRGFTVRNSTAGNPISNQGNRAFVTNMKMFNNAKGAIVGGAGSVVDGFHSVDCDDANFNLWMNGTGPTLRNATAEQTSSIPSGQKGFTFTSAPRETSNVRAVSAGTDYTGANVLNLIGGVSASTVMSCVAPGFWTEDTLSTDKGDAAATLTRGLSERTQIWDTAITADRAVTLSTTNAKNGDEFRIIRTANATGAFNLNVGTGPLKAMGTAGSYAVVRYNGSAWILSEYGTL